MPPSEPGRVFISYAHLDGAELAHRLQADLAKNGFEVWLDKRRLKSGASWTNEIETALDEAEYVLTLLTPASYVSEICRAEQLRALRKRKCVIPLLAQPTAEIPEHLIPLHLETKRYLDFGTSEYARAFAELLNDIHGRSGATLDDARHIVIDKNTGVTREATPDEIKKGEAREEKYRQKFRETYVTAPPLPVNYLERPTELAALRDAVITDGSGRNVALTALEGMGGIGKTVLAKALCRDEVVQQAFPDGIVWITVGEESAFDVVTRLREAGKVLNDDLSRYDNELGATNQYRSTIASKAALVVIDDVWKARDIQPFLAESTRSRLLFTTRNGNIAAAVGAREHIAELLNIEQSREVLGRWAGIRSADLPLLANDLIRECGRLPLALSMVGAMLRGKPPSMWRWIHDLLMKARIDKIAVEFPDYPYPSLLAAIRVSLDALDVIARERYLALAVVLEDMPVSPVIQQCLWKVDELEAIETAEHFVSVSLAQRDGADGSIRLHDLQLDYLRAQYPESTTLALIHDAMRLSSHALATDSSQFASQIVGRLLLHGNKPAVNRFLKDVIESAPRPWLRPLWPALDAPSGKSVRALASHPGKITAVAASTGSGVAVSASEDNTLKVWDLETGRELLTLRGHSAPVVSVAISPDARYVVSASQDSTLKLWDLETGRELLTLRGHSAPVLRVVVSSNGLIFSISEDNSLKIWDPKSGRERSSLKFHSAKSLALSANGRRAVSAHMDGTLKVWEDLCLVRAIEGHSDPVRGMAVSSDGNLAVSTADKTLKVWNLTTGRELQSLRSDSPPTAVAVSREGTLVVFASQDKTLRVWDLRLSRVDATFTCESRAQCCAFVDDQRVIAGDSLGRVYLLRLEGAKPKS